MNQFPAIPIGIFVAVAYVFFWCGLMIVIARLSGWLALGRHFRAEQPFSGKCWYFQHAQFRWSLNYSGALTVGANEHGLYISIWPMFRMGHPKLMIPWSETKIVMKQSFWLGNHMELQFPELPGIVIRFHERLARRIAATVGPQLAQPNPSELPNASAV